MECEHCHKHPATLHFTQYIHGNKHVQHLCQTCALEQGLIEQNDQYPIHDLLSDLFKFNTKITTQQNKLAEDMLVCPTCQMTQQQFVKHYKFGCKDCYEIFSSELEPVLKRVHNGNTTHTGKMPKAEYAHQSKRQQIKDYRSQLKALIDDERFEEAADIRDAIRALENGRTEIKEDH